MDALTTLDFTALETLAAQSDAVHAACACCSTPLTGWASLPVFFPEAQVRRIGTLILGKVDEATVAEFHPEGTDYWAPQAPIAPRYFPFNRCDAWECSVCSRVYLRYTEGGGYFVDQRIRALTHAALVDAPLP